MGLINQAPTIVTQPLGGEGVSSTPEGDANAIHGDKAKVMAKTGVNRSPCLC